MDLVVLSVMDFFRPATWPDALAVKAANPGVLAIAGGTDVMVDINFDRVRPAALLDLTGVCDLAEWSADGPVIRLGAGVPYARVISELGDRLPGLAGASRTVGSPQIRNRGTVGGNLGSASRRATPIPRCWPATLWSRRSRCAGSGTFRSASSTPG